MRTVLSALLVAAGFAGCSQNQAIVTDAAPPRTAPVAETSTKPTVTKAKPAPVGEAFTSPGGATLIVDTKRFAKPTVLMVGAGFCNICKREATAIAAALASHADKVDTIGVIVDPEQATAQAFVERHKLTFRTIWDPEWRLAVRYKISATPTLLLLGRDGGELARAGGMTPEFERQLTAQ